MASLSSDFGRRELRFWEKVRGLSWGLVLLIGAAACFGVAVLYSAADGGMDPWAADRLPFCPHDLMIGVALVDIAIGSDRLWGLRRRTCVGDRRRYARLCRHGAQRWIDLGVIQLQPSALMNVAMVLALSRYFQSQRRGCRPHPLLVSSRLDGSCAGGAGPQTARPQYRYYATRAAPRCFHCRDACVSS